MQKQRTDEWFAERLGRATASRFGAIMAGKHLAGYKNYRAELVIERLTGQKADSFTSKEMQWGIDTEPLAQLQYTLTTGRDIEECGFFAHKTIAAGASPDGLIGKDGLVEIKCPNSATHLETLRSGQIPNQYVAQVQGQLWVTGRKWADFESFDPRLPANADKIIIRVPRDDEYIKKLEAGVKEFLKTVDEEVKFVKSYKGV